MPRAFSSQPLACRRSPPAKPLVCTVVSPVGEIRTSMILAIGVFSVLGDLTFQVLCRALMLFDGVECPPQPLPPAVDGGTRTLKSGAELVPATLASRIGRLRF